MTQRRHHPKTRAILTLLTLLLALTANAQFAAIQNFGGAVTLKGLSRDGKVAVGYNSTGAFYGTIDGTIHPLPGAKNSQAYAANYDGSVIVGIQQNLPIVWFNGASYKYLPLLAGTTFGGATLINSDGSTIAGYCGTTPCIWTFAGTLALPQPNHASVLLNAISDDGSAIAGDVYGNYGNYEGNFQNGSFLPQQPIIYQLDGAGTQVTSVNPSIYNPYGQHAYESIFALTSDGSQAYGGAYDLYSPSAGTLATDGLWSVGWNSIIGDHYLNLPNMEVHAANGHGTLLAGRLLQADNAKWSTNKTVFDRLYAVVAFGGQEHKILTILQNKGLSPSSDFAVPEAMSEDGSAMILDNKWFVSITPQISAFTFRDNPLLGGHIEPTLITTDYPVGANATVTVTTNNTAAIPNQTYNMTEGSTSLSYYFQTNPVSVATTVTLTATLGSSSYKSTLTLYPPLLISFTASPLDLVGGGQILARIVLSYKSGPQGEVVNLTSSSPAVTVPSSVTVPAGQNYLYQYFATSPVAQQTNVTLTASFNGTSYSYVVTVEPPPFTSFTLSSSSVQGGKTVLARFAIAAKAPSPGLRIYLAANSSAVTLPGYITIPTGQNYLYVYFPTTKVSSNTPVTITASYANQSLQTNLTVTP